MNDAYMKKHDGLPKKGKPTLPTIERRGVDVERRGLIIDIDQGQFFVGLTDSEVVTLCQKLQESLILRATHDGFMRRSTYDKP